MVLSNYSTGYMRQKAKRIKQILLPRIVAEVFGWRVLFSGNPVNTLTIFRAFVDLDRGETVSAEIRFRNALESSRTDYRACIGLAMVMMRRERLDEGLGYWEASILHRPRLSILRKSKYDPKMGKAECLFAMFRFSECRHLLHEVIEELPADPDAYRVLANMDLREGKYEQALSWWGRMEEQFPNTLTPLLGQARCLLEMRRFSQAEELLHIGKLYWPESTELALLRSRLAMNTARPDLAKETLLHLIGTHPHLISAYTLLFELFKSTDELVSLQPLIDKVPTHIRKSQVFATEILLPYYIEIRDSDGYLHRLETSVYDHSARAEHMRARYHLLIQDFYKLVDIVEGLIAEFPYYLPNYGLLLRGYRQTDQLEEMALLRKAMINRFGASIVYPLVLQLGLRFIGDDLIAASRWLLENPCLRDRYMTSLLDGLLHRGDEKEMSAVLSTLKGQLTADENIRVLGVECQIRDSDLLSRSMCSEVDWREFELSLDSLKADLEKEVHCLDSTWGRSADLVRYYESYVETINQYDASSLYSRESFHDAVATTESVFKKIDAGIPTSLIRLGDGEGNFLPYRPDVQQYVQLDRCAIQKVWWGKACISEDDGNNLARYMLNAVDNADFVGIPPPWRVIEEIFPQGRLNFSTHNRRGTLAVIDLMSSDLLSRSKTLVSSAIANDLSRWDLYTQLLSTVRSLSYIACHDLESFILRSYGVESRQKLKIPAEYTHRQMFVKRRNHTVQSNEKELSIYPHVFEKISREIQPRPGEVYLVAAGFLGKFFCDLVKRRGGIGIDIGSAADYWMGYETRRYKNHEFGFDLKKCLIRDMPLNQAPSFGGLSPTCHE